MELFQKSPIQFIKEDLTESLKTGTLRIKPIGLDVIAIKDENAKLQSDIRYVENRNV